MLLSTFVGNNSVKESLLGALASGRLSHGLMICGEKGTGINRFALLLAADIVDEKDTDNILQGKNPLVQTVEGEGASGQIKVDRIRRVNNNVNFSSISGEKRVVIIFNCENFNAPSANAMLKNLEEPKDDITYILTSNRPRSVLPTIRSRCSVYTISEPDMQRTKRYFEARGVAADMLRALCSVYGANIGRIQAACEPGRYAVLSSALEACGCVDSGDGYGLSVVCYRYAKDKEKLARMLEDMECILLKRLSARAVKAIAAVQKYSGLLRTNVNLNLAIEAFSVECVK